SRTICIGSRYWRTNARQRGSVSAATKAFGPYVSSRVPASAGESPACASTPSSAATASPSSANHCLSSVWAGGGAAAVAIVVREAFFCRSAAASPPEEDVRLAPGGDALASDCEATPRWHGLCRDRTARRDRRACDGRLWQRRQRRALHSAHLDASE